jgi:hypothetical protein
MTWWMVRPTVFAFLILVPLAALAQGPDPSPAPRAAASDQPLLKSEELDALVAPIALYPDTLLAEVLMASTYPLELVQADRWATTKGDQPRYNPRSSPGSSTVDNLHMATRRRRQKDRNKARRPYRVPQVR